MGSMYVAGAGIRFLGLLAVFSGMLVPGEEEEEEVDDDEEEDEEEEREEQLEVSIRGGSFPPRPWKRMSIMTFDGPETNRPNLEEKYRGVKSPNHL